MKRSPWNSGLFFLHAAADGWSYPRRKGPWLLFLALIAILVWSSPGTVLTSTVAASSPERVLRLAGDDYGFPSPYGFYPRGPGYLRMSLLFDTLVWKDQKGLVPLLASRWEEKDGGRVWIFELNPKARWHDGPSVTAADVVFTFRYFQQNRHPWFDLSAVKEVRELDTHRVEISLKEPYAPFLSNLAGSLPILPKHIWEKVQDPKKFLTPAAVIGSGPFRLEKYDREQALYIYTANPDYFLGRPVIDRLILRPQAEPVLALRKGEIDGASLKVDEAALLNGDPKLKVIEGPALWVYRLYFNLLDPLLNQKAFRQAVAYAINRQEIVDRALHGGATPGVAGYIPPSSPWYTPTTDYPFNPDQARQLLDGLGLKDQDGDGYREGPKGEKLNYQLLFASPYARVAELVQGYLKAVGLKVELKALDTKALDGLMEKNQYQLALNGHGGIGGDPVHLSRFTSSFGSQAPAQWSNTWAYRQFDDLFQQQVHEMDATKRKELVGRLQGLLAEELPTLPLYYPKMYFAFNPQVLGGWYYTPDGIAIGIPTEMNKLIFLQGSSGEPAAAGVRTSARWWLIGLGILAVLYFLGRRRLAKA